MRPGRQELAYFVQYSIVSAATLPIYCQFVLQSSLGSIEEEIIAMTDRVDINRLLVEMRSMKTQTQAFQRPQGISPSDRSELRAFGTANIDGVNKVPGFGEVMSQAVNKVNEVQKSSAAMATAYEQGVAGVDITDVMIASQKASVSFQAMVQVRNKLVEAYRDVMNMPI